MQGKSSSGRVWIRLDALLAESLRIAHATGALKTGDLARITVDTTVQPKAVTHPADAKLMLKAIEKLGQQAKSQGLKLRQSYARLAKRAALMASRYTHVKQSKRANRALKFLRTRLGRLIRDITRKIANDERLKALFAEPLSKALRIRWQNHNQRGPKLYSWHAPEVECIGKGKAHKPYEFGTKVSVATTNRRAKGGQFVLHAKALPGNPYDGHTLAGIIEETEKLTGREIERAYVDKGYRGHNAPRPLRVFISGQKRGVHGAIKREPRRRAAIEPVIGHMTDDGHLGRNFLKGTHGQRRALSHRPQSSSHPQMAEASLAPHPGHDPRRPRRPISAQTRFLTGDYLASGIEALTEITEAAAQRHQSDWQVRVPPNESSLTLPCGSYTAVAW